MPSAFSPGAAYVTTVLICETHCIRHGSFASPSVRISAYAARSRNVKSWAGRPKTRSEKAPAHIARSGAAHACVGTSGWPRSNAWSAASTKVSYAMYSPAPCSSVCAPASFSWYGHHRVPIACTARLTSAARRRVYGAFCSFCALK